MPLIRDEASVDRSTYRPPSGGFTFQEMLVTLAIGAILAAGAVGTAVIVEENRLRGEVNGLVAHLSLARSEAVKRGAPVTLCTSPDGAACASSAGWKEGWIVFADDNGNHVRDEDEDLLRIREGLAPDFRLRYGESGTYHHLTYKPDGSASPNATFTFCDGRGATKARAIIVHWTGRTRISTKKSDGGALACG